MENKIKPKTLTIIALAILCACIAAAAVILILSRTPAEIPEVLQTEDEQTPADQHTDDNTDPDPQADEGTPAEPDGQDSEDKTDEQQEQQEPSKQDEQSSPVVDDKPDEAEAPDKDTQASVVTPDKQPPVTPPTPVGPTHADPPPVTPATPVEPPIPPAPPAPPTPPTETAMATMKDFLSSALTPIGSTLYVYGGGWNESDTAAGIETKSVGLSPSWKQFFDANNSAYDYKTTSYQIHNGLDCTGFVGYAAWQVFGDRYSKDGYVFASGKVGSEFTRLFGGSVTPKNQFGKHRAGDIMVKTGHVFIVLGECSDGSILIAHASPPSVTLSGTCTPAGVKNSEALALAEKYMKKIAPTAYERYPQNCSRGITYLTDYDCYRFPDTVLSDPDGLHDMPVGDLMEELTKGK